MATFNISIPTFVNPHLFWVVEKGKTTDKIVAGLESAMKLEYEENSQKEAEQFEVGFIVAVHKDNKYHRAIIEDIIQDTGDSKRPTNYLCWLMDAGVMYETNKVLKLPIKCKKTPPQAYQAALNNVVFIHELLTYDGASPVKVNKASTSSSNLIRQTALDCLSNSRTLQFQMGQEVDGVKCGDILYKKNGSIISLTETLIEKNLLVLDKKMFCDLLPNIAMYRDTHTSFIHQICKQTTSKLKSLSLVNEYLEECADKDIYDVDENRSHFVVSNKRRSVKTESESDNSCQNTSDRHNDTSDDAKYRQKRQALIERIKRCNNKKVPSTTNSPQDISSECMRSTRGNKSISGESTSSSISSPGEKLDESCNVASPPCSAQNKLAERLRNKKSGQVYDSSSSSPSTPLNKLAEYLKAKHAEKSREESCTDTNESKIDAASTESKNTSLNDLKPRRVLHHNSMMPAGATYSMPPKKKSQEKHRRISDHNLTEHSTKHRSHHKTSVEKCESQSTSEESRFQSQTRSQSEFQTNTTASECEGNGEMKDAIMDEVPIRIKTACGCNQCEHWNRDRDWKTRSDARYKKVVPLKLPPLLKNVDEEEVEIEMKTLSFDRMTRVEKQATTKLQIQGDSIPLPVKYVHEAFFHKDIHKSLHELDYKESKRIQAYAWPAITRNQHVCVIHGPKTGKSMCYLPVISSYILEKNERFTDMPKGGGPIILVLCKNSRKCEEIYDLFNLLIGKNEKKTRAKAILITYPNTQINTSNIEILITLPHVLMDLLKTNAVNLKRLCNFVIDDCDVILKKSPAIIDYLLSLANDTVKNRVFYSGIQMIFIGEQLNKNLKNVLRKLKRPPFLCIGNYLEAALAGGMDFSLQFVHSTRKELQVRDILKEKSTYCKSIIFCNDDEVKEIATILMFKGIETYAIDSSVRPEDAQLMEAYWNELEPGNYKVLICPDSVFHTELTVTSATLIIHYSLPKTWSQFWKRYSCFLENNQNPLVESKKKLKCQSYILPDEKTVDQLTKFLGFLNRMEVTLPEVLETYYKDVKTKLEHEKIDKKTPLCDDMKLFGKCRDPECTNRHILDKNLDISEYLPQRGKVTFQIIEIFDVSHFSAKLFEHQENDIVRQFDNTCTITDDLTEYMQKTDTHKAVKKLAIREWYAYLDMDESVTEMYYRCELLSIDGDFVQIKLLDKGTSLKTIKTRLFRLPSSFRKIPSKIVEIYLSNFIPPYLDENFSARSYFKLVQLLSSNFYKDAVFTGTVQLQLENTLWLKDVIEEVEIDNLKLCKFRLTDGIQSFKLAENTASQMMNLHEACERAEIPVVKDVAKVVKTERVLEQVKPQWAFFENDKPNEAIFGAAITPDEFYVRLNKFSDLLRTLQKDIQETVKRPNYHRNFKTTVGQSYLALDPVTGEYCRVLVMRIQDDKALCFFVDYGEEAIIACKDLKYLSNNLISKLPFQTIQCSLEGVKPILDDWDETAVNILYEFSLEPQTDIFRSLWLKPRQKRKSTIAGQNSYTTLLKDGYGEKRVLINKLMIDCGLALPASDDPIEDFRISDVEKSESDEELKQLNDILVKTQLVTSTSMDVVKTNRHICDNGYSSEGFDCDEFDGMDVCIFNPLKFFNELKENQILDSKPTLKKAADDSNSQASTSKLPQDGQAGVPFTADHYTPTVQWSQTDKYVKLNIQLPNVHNYSVNLLKGRIFNFKTDVDEKPYKLKLMLFEKVEQSFQHTSVGPQIRITFTKFHDGPWTRLILGEEKMRNIHYEVTSYDVPEEKKKRILDLGLSDSDESIDMMYEVVSDQDSEFDVEIEFSD